MRNNSIIRTEIKKNKSMMALVVILGILSTVSGTALMYVSGFLISSLFTVGVCEGAVGFFN